MTGRNPVVAPGRQECERIIIRISRSSAGLLMATAAVILAGAGAAGTNGEPGESAVVGSLQVETARTYPGRHEQRQSDQSRDDRAKHSTFSPVR